MNLVAYATLLQWRGKGLASQLLSKMLEELKEKQVNGIWALVDIDHLPSIKTLTKMEFKRIDIIKHMDRLKYIMVKKL